MAERIDYITEKNTRMVGDHLYRYWLAMREINCGDTVVDAACGFGYGAALLGKKYDVDVVAIDKLDFDTIENTGQINYKNVLYLNCDLNVYRFKNADVLVSFETIEHLENPYNLIKQFDKFNKVILSTPIIPTKHTNKAHLQDFTTEQVLGWFSKDVWNIKWQLIQNDVYIVLCAEKI